MYKANDYVIYDRYLCKIINIIPKFYNNNDYYNLEYIYDKEINIKVPTNKNGLLKPLLDKTQIDDLFKNIDNIELINYDEDEYRKLINDGSRENLVKIIKSFYLNSVKVEDYTESYISFAEELLYGEISLVLGISYEEAKKEILTRLKI